MPRDIGGGIVSTPKKAPPPPAQVTDTSMGGNTHAGTDTTLRHVAAREIANRALLFPEATVAKHPHTVAALIHSSYSTQKLQTVAKHLDAMYEVARYRNSTFVLQHDPDTMNPGFDPANQVYRNAAIHQEMERIRTELQSGHLTDEERSALGMGDADYRSAAEATSGTGQMGLSFEQRLRNVAINNLNFRPEPTPLIPAIANYAMKPFSLGLHWGGETLDTLGHIPGVGLGVRAVHSTLDVSLDVLGQNASRAGRLLGTATAIPGMEIAQAQGHDTDWGALLDFWRLDHHDPNTVAAANIQGMDVDDPRFAETAMSLDVVFGATEQIALGKIIGGVGEWTRVPKNMGGGIDAATIADHNILNGGLFNKLAKLYEQSPPTTRVGRTLASTRRMDPRLAKVMADAYEFGATRSAKILSMKEAFVDYIKGNMKDLDARAKDLNARIAEDPGNPQLLAERTRLDSIREQVAQRNPIGEWPRYQDVRGALKGSPATTRVGRFVKAVYDKRPLQSVTEVTKFTDNLRDRFRVWDWTSKRAPRDAVRQNAQSLGRLMRSSGVPEETIATRLGEMLDPRTVYSEWYMKVTHDIVEAAKPWADPVTLKRIESSLRNDEMFSNRANYTVEMIDPKTGAKVNVRRPVIERSDGTHAPTQINEMSHGARVAGLKDFRDVTQGQKMSALKKNPTVKMLLKTKDNIAATWRAITIVTRGPAINMAIQSEEGLTAFFTNTPIKGVRRGIDFVVTKIPLSEAAQDAAARRLGFADVHQARAVYAIMKKDPESLGQIMANYAEETTRRIEVPAKDFNTRYMNGQIELGSTEANESFSDLVWQIEHTATDPMSRTLLNYGPERTARLMLGEGTPGTGPIPEGAVRLFSERRATELPGLKERGIVADAKTSEGRGNVVWSQERLEGTNATRVAEGTLPEDYVVVEHWATPEEARRVGTMGADAVQTGAVPPERIVRIWEGGKGPATGSQTLENWGDTVQRYIEGDPSYSGTPHEKIVDFLTRKEGELESLAGGNPDVLDLMAHGRSTRFKLADAEGDLEMVQDELEQIHQNLGDPETHPAQARSLIERRNELLKRAEAPETTLPRRLKISKNNRAIRTWLKDEAAGGRYELPETRWRRVSKSGYEDAQEIRRGALSKINKVSYATMKWMNSDYMRAGFAEAKYTKWLKRYREAGWREGDARAAATAQAQFEVRDWLHDIGNKSSFQRFFRNEAPFYHAWERVAYRWFVKVPNYMGAGFTPLGWAIESNIVSGFYNMLKQVGVVHEVKLPGGDTRDAVYLPNPLTLLNWVPGFEAPPQVDVLDPHTVVFPPTHLLHSLPGLAPWALFGLEKTADWTHAPFLEELHNEFTHDGAFDIRFPGASQATSIWEHVTGEVPPWAIGHSKKYQEYVVARARDASLRYAYTKLAKEGTLPPNPADFQTREDYAGARDRYWARLTAEADDYHTGLSMTYLLSTESPLSSFKPTSQEEVAWRSFLQENGLNGPRDEHDWALIEDYLGEHPESFAYNVSMYDKTSKWPADKGYLAFREAVGKGDIRISDYGTYKSILALDQQWAYRAEAEDAALRKAGLANWDQKSAQFQLLHEGEFQAATAPVWKDFNEFLAEDDGAKRLYEKYASPATKAHDRLQEIDDQASDHPAGWADKAKQEVYDRLAENTEYGTTKKEHVYWYKHVALNDWYNATGDIYDEIHQLEDAPASAPGTSERIGVLYDKIRKINATYPPIVGPDGKRYPPPEQYDYARGTPEDQLVDRENWASKPPSWLTPFQYETTYGKVSGNEKMYFNQEEKVQNYFDHHTANLSHTSTEYGQWIKWREQSLDILAKRNETPEIRKLEKSPPIVRLEAAGLTPDSEGMNWVVDQSKAIATKLAANGSFWTSSSADAQYYRGWLESYISKMRTPSSPLYDARVDRFFTKKAHDLHITDEGTLYRYVLFGITGSIEFDLDFSSEDKAARG